MRSPCGLAHCSTTFSALVRLTFQTNEQMQLATRLRYLDGVLSEVTGYVSPNRSSIRGRNRDRRSPATLSDVTVVAWTRLLYAAHELL